MRTLCKVVVYGFALLYALAFLLLIVGTYGLFGADPDPLSGIFLIMLGQPWISLVGDVPESMNWITGVLAPAINLLILWGLCRLMTRRA